MDKLIAVVFQSAGKIYYFSTNGENVEFKDRVVAQSDFGIEVGTTVKVNVDRKEVDLNNIFPIVRLMTNEDLEIYKKNLKDADSAMNVCRKKIKEHDLQMKLVKARYMLDRSKLLFYFTAEERVDFRALVKDLASIFRTRIELRQIGVRDEFKIKGGIGMCGRELCCATHLRTFEGVTLKYAKQQQLYINPSKISGACGKLLCCLRYEADVYQEELKNIPDLGEETEIEGKKGVVTQYNIFTKEITVQTRDSEVFKIPFRRFRR
ncbi:MAG: stage 0 sporulation protein [Thermotoga sp.]|nr:stage 0 sporulation protein [Thermotogota bacterium]RKX51387.1 MAG: stage 0 sporulation protein [Thermotoga sp.]